MKTHPRAARSVLTSFTRPASVALALAVGACAAGCAQNEARGEGSDDAGAADLTPTDGEETDPANDTDEVVDDSGGLDATVDGSIGDAVVEVDVDADAGDPFDPAIRERLDALLMDAPDVVGAPGITIRVSSPTLGNYAAAAGLASTRDGTTMEPDDRLRVGSITKTFTAALTLLLIQDGLIGIDDTVDGWVPGFDFGDGVTVRTLLDHQGGIYNYTDDAAFVPLGADPADPIDVVRFADSHGRVHPPGEAYSYTNTGYFLLGLIIEAATGERYDQALRERILDPQGLADSYSQPAESDAAFVRGHTLGNEATDLVHASWAWSAGGMISNGRDLCTWIDRVATGEIVGDDTDAMLGPALLADGTPTPYGYGIQRMQRAGWAVVGHTGSTMGFRGELFFEPTSHTCVAILTNDFFAEVGGFSDSVWEAVLGAPR